MALKKFMPNAGPGGFRRWSIDHKRGGYKSSDGMHQYQLNGIAILGVIPTRKMWGVNPSSLTNEEKATTISLGGLLCRSPDNVTGLPGKNFNNLQDISAAHWEKTIQTMFDCAQCPFKDFSKNRPVCKLSYYVVFWFVTDQEKELQIIEFSQSGATVMKPVLESVYAEKSFFDKCYNLETSTVDQNGNIFSKPSIELDDLFSISEDLQMAMIQNFERAKESVVKDFRVQQNRSSTNKLTPIVPGQ